MPGASLCCLCLKCACVSVGVLLGDDSINKAMAAMAERAPIRRLDAVVVNRIAAGEVRVGLLPEDDSEWK